MGGGPESRCLGRVHGLDGAVRLVLSCWGVVRVNNHLEQRVRIDLDAGELPRRKNTTFRTRRKFEIKNFEYTFSNNFCGPKMFISFNGV